MARRKYIVGRKAVPIFTIQYTEYWNDIVREENIAADDFAHVQRIAIDISHRDLARIISITRTKNTVTVHYPTT